MLYWQGRIKPGGVHTLNITALQADIPRYRDGEYRTNAVIEDIKHFIMINDRETRVNHEGLIEVGTGGRASSALALASVGRLRRRPKVGFPTFPAPSRGVIWRGIDVLTTLKLDLSYLQMGSAECTGLVQMMREAAGLHTVSLELHNNRIGNAGCRELVRMCHGEIPEGYNSGLKFLHLGLKNNRIGRGGAEWLAELKNGRHNALEILELDLEGNQIDHVGAGQILTVGNNTRLQWNRRVGQKLHTLRLNLKHNVIEKSHRSGSGVAWLVNGIQEPSTNYIRHLEINLDNNYIDLAGLHAIADWSVWKYENMMSMHIYVRSNRPNDGVLLSDDGGALNDKIEIVNVRPHRSFEI